MRRRRIAPQHDLRIGRASVEGTHVYDAGQAWHYVTLGLTELYDQSDASVGPNGIRCELSMRVAKHDSTEPPLWPVAFLGKIASHVSQGAVLAPGSRSAPAPSPGLPRMPGSKVRWRSSIRGSNRGRVPSARSA